MTKGIFSSTSVGRTFCGSSAISVAACSGMMMSALVIREHRHERKRDVTDAPDHQAAPRCACTLLPTSRAKTRPAWDRAEQSWSFGREKNTTSVKVGGGRN